MKIAVVGAGAMGGMLAAKFAAAGNEVTLIDVSEPLIRQVNEHGLIIDTKGQGCAAHMLRVTACPGDLGIQDAVFFFIKAHHTASAAENARPMIGQNTVIVSLQNGWGNADVLSNAFPEGDIVVGVTYHSATVLELGKVGHTGFGATFVGPYSEGAGMASAERIGTLLNEAGIETEATPNVKTEIWKKLILNAATLPTSALTGLCAGIQGEEGPLLELVDDLAAEAVAVAQALGYDIDREERIERIHTVLRNAGKGKSSMLQDAEAKRKTEVEVVNGAIVRAAAQTGVPVPLNMAMAALVAGLERSWRA
ncbi:ketopantoate reductase family protein [Paenibacillus montanisoli]|uniref:2-dehydropantoate 2-reductase n=1 Tax=Paenibacillus montanisoli TaxID=2081970 RepID=A0A328U505_9BACL|nr:2-dehydropantoate 2-reductase [Paenibacillus montanisoli]RAP77629.1 2-dehydropantoate 2-reductase [Paenibacillus montanisoli]